MTYIYFYIASQPYAQPFIKAYKLVKIYYYLSVTLRFPFNSLSTISINLPILANYYACYASALSFISFRVSAFGQIIGSSQSDYRYLVLGVDSSGCTPNTNTFFSGLVSISSQLVVNASLYFLLGSSCSISPQVQPRFVQEGLLPNIT